MKDLARDYRSFIRGLKHGVFSLFRLASSKVYAEMRASRITEAPTTRSTSNRLDLRSELCAIPIGATQIGEVPVTRAPVPANGLQRPSVIQRLIQIVISHHPNQDPTSPRILSNHLPTTDFIPYNSHGIFISPSGLQHPPA